MREQAHGISCSGSGGNGRSALLPLGLQPLLLLLLLLAFPGCGQPAEETAADGGLPDGGSQLCRVDANNGRDTAVQLTPGEPVSEFICTRSDTDWYRFELPPGRPILEVWLANQVEHTPVTYRYAVFDAAGQPVPGVEGQDPGRGKGRVQLAGRHRLPRADVYFLVVRDENGLEVDRLNPYTLSIATSPDPDPDEPAERAEVQADAVDLAQGARVRFLSHGGDADWFSLETSPGELLRVSLRVAAAARIRPRYRLFAEGVEGSFGGSRVAAVAGDPDTWRTERVHALPAAAGRILIEVADETAEGSDLDEGYVIEASSLPEMDQIEAGGRNDRPDQAVELGEGGEVLGGRLGSLGDVDWFVVRPPVNVTERAPRRLELDLQFDAAPQGAAAALRPVIDVFLSHRESRCISDDTCGLLSGVTCNHDAECPGGVCREGQHRCEAAGFCLPTARCGVLLFSSPMPTGGERAPRVHTVAPLLIGDPLFIAVHDQQDDDHQTVTDPASYRLAARVLPEPDSGENDGIWFPWGSSDEDQARVISAARARTVAAPEVVRDPESGALIELSYPLLEGYISFAGDQDWFLLEIPEEVDGPATDWQTIADYSAGGSPLSLAWTIYNGPHVEPNAGWIGGYQQIPDEGLWGDDECCYLCHRREGPLWLRIAEDVPRQGWDDVHPYTVSLRLVPGCPDAICPCARECPP